MSEAMLDLQKYASGLEKSGVTEAQAQGMAWALASALPNSREALATKHDLELLDARIATKDDLASVKRELETKMATKQDLNTLQSSVNESIAKLSARFMAIQIGSLAVLLAAIGVAATFLVPA